MSLTTRELWTALHGMILGGALLLAFAGGFAGLWSLRPGWLTTEGGTASLRSLMLGTWTTAVLAWATVLIGTYVIYPWYRGQPRTDLAGGLLSSYPRSYLLSDTRTAGWHQFGMEWKEHVAWFAPILTTAVAYVVTRHRRELLHEPGLRRMLRILFAMAFLCAGLAGLLGAFINKAAQIR